MLNSNLLQLAITARNMLLPAPTTSPPPLANYGPKGSEYPFSLCFPAYHSDDDDVPMNAPMNAPMMF